MKYMNMLRNSITALLALCVINSYAVDPVAWSVLPTSGLFPATTNIGTSSWAMYTLTNKLPLPVTLITSFKQQGGPFNIYQNCNQQTIAPKASCYIIIEFAPTTTEKSSIELTYGYHDNRIPLPTIIGTSTGTPPPESGVITGSISNIPPFSLNNPTQTPQFTVTYVNSSSVPVTVTGYAGDAGGNELLTATPSTVATVEVLPGSTCGSSTAPIMLTQGQSCHISGKLTPHATGSLTVSGLFTYNAGANTSTPSTGTLVTSGGTGTCPVTQSSGSAITGSALYMPATTYQYTDNMIKFVLTNTSTDQSAHLGQVSIASNLSTEEITLTPSATYDTCSNQTLAAQESCYVMASVIPTVTTSNLIITASAPCNTETVHAVTPPAKVTNFSSNTTNHNIVFVNQCPFPVWYEFANNSTTGGADPTPAGGSYQVNSPVNGVPTPVTLSVSEYLNGGLYARTGCDTATGSCATGTCGSISPSDPMRCAVGVQPPNNLPLTKMEMNLEPYNNGSPVSDGVYDVSMVNGFNIPAEVRSLAIASSSNVFGCGQSAGAVIQPSSGAGLGSCPWKFTPPNTGAPYITPNFVSVTNPTPSSCTSTPTTSSGTCGIGYNSDPTINSMNQGYSTFLGYWNIFSYVNPGAWGNVDLHTAFTLSSPLSSISSQDYGTYNGHPATYADMWGCLITSNDSLESGYSTNTGSGLVCGCYQWNLPGSSVPTADGTCNANNSDWEAVVYPYILWLKQACPTAYSWNHDDPSSSFTCSNNSATALTNYQITYCPGGETGLLTGAPDGRNIVP